MRFKPRSEKEVEHNWNHIWKEILQHPDGSIDVEQLKLELMDFSDMIGRITMLTSHISGNRLSYPVYSVETILQVEKEKLEEEREEQIEEDKKDGQCSLCDREF